MPAHARELGKRGELIAQDFYRTHGYDIVASNVYYRGGELDLVVRPSSGPPGAIVFVEVKTRSSDAFGTAETVTATKFRRMRHAAARWLQERNCAEEPSFIGEIRFDVVVVSADRDAANGACVEVFEGVEHGAC